MRGGICVFHTLICSHYPLAKHNILTLRDIDKQRSNTVELAVLHPALASLATPLLHALPSATRAKTDSGGSVVPSQIPVWCDKGASITVSATFGYAERWRRPRTPPSSGDSVLWPSRQVAGMADAIIEA